MANSVSYVCSLGGLKLGTRASPSKVNKIDTTEQLIEDGVIGLSEKEKAGAWAEGEQREADSSLNKGGDAD